MKLQVELKSNAVQFVTAIPEVMDVLVVVSVPQYTKFPPLMDAELRYALPCTTPVFTEPARVYHHASDHASPCKLVVTGSSMHTGNTINHTSVHYNAIATVQAMRNRQQNIETLTDAAGRHRGSR